MFSIWINGILSSLDGYSAHNTDFLALVKVLLTYIWRWLAKCSSSSFYSACGDRGLKQIRKFFFQISAMYFHYLTKMTKRPPYQFFPCNFYKRRFGPQNFLTFSFNPFATLVQNFKFLPSASPNLLNLNQDQPSKKAIFLVKSL